MIYVTQGKLEQLVYKDAASISESNQRMVSKDSA
jgi:hypothetical protein